MRSRHEGYSTKFCAENSISLGKLRQRKKSEKIELISTDINFCLQDTSMMGQIPDNQSNYEIEWLSDKGIYESMISKIVAYSKER